MSTELNVLEHVGFSHCRKMDDRRRTERFPFNQPVHVVACEAEPDGGLFDLLNRMTAVPAHDISQSGIAFYLPSKPTSSTYLVRLGEIPSAMLILVRVARTQEGYWLRQRQFRVGCEFIRRIPF